MSKAKHTPGPWHHGKPFSVEIEGRGKCQAIGIGSGSVHIGYVSITGCVSEAEALANARLIAEAGTVATETGLTPRQLAEQRAKLFGALKDLEFWASIPDNGSKDAVVLLRNKARAAIAKAEQFRKE